MEKVEQSILMAEKFLLSAKKNFEIEEYESCEIIGYNSLFHFARALLFRKGYIERSHACLFTALEKLYPNQKELIQKADRFRMERHNLQYMGFASNRESAFQSLKFIEEFGKMAKERIKE